MPRPRRDGAPAEAPRKARLTELAVKRLKPARTAYLVWDTHQRGLAIRVQPTGGKAWKAIYSFHGRPRWLHIGDANAIGLADARKLTAGAMLAVAHGKDPAAERKAERGAGTFAELSERYVEHAKKKNKSWTQSAYLTERYLLPRWGKLQPVSIARADVKAIMAKIAAPILANQVLAAASAIFSWAVKEEILPTNPCKLIARNKTTSRERVLSDSEIPRFWSSFDDAGLVEGTALKLILLLGQRPGEIAHMRREHIKDGWWEMPGAPVPELGWPGTKNQQTHRLWLPTAAQAHIAELSDGPTGFVFPAARGRRSVWGLDAAMRMVCTKLGVERATPHDLRRTHGSTITALGFGRDAMNRVQNHKEGGVTDTYDRYQYAEENRRVMEAVAGKIVALATDETDAKVVPIRR
jgi:integrase